MNDKSKLIIAFQGMAGAYSNMACEAYFPNSKTPLAVVKASLPPSSLTVFICPVDLTINLVTNLSKCSCFARKCNFFREPTIIKRGSK